MKHTHAQMIEGQRYSTRRIHGSAVPLALLLGRTWHGAGAKPARGGAQAAQQASPLTMAIAATLIAYSLVYSVGLVLRMRRLALPQLPPQ